MAKGRIDAADTIDTATHFLHRLAAEGWALASLEHEFQYGSPAPKDPKAPLLPIEAKLVITLIPARSK
jgi:hypothetical protein